MTAGLAQALVLLTAGPAASWPGITVAVVCVQAAGGVAVSVLTAIGQAALARLWFRHRIEVIRDEAVTAVLDGIVPPVGPATEWLAALEAIAGHARRRDIEAACAVLAGFPAGNDPAGTWPGLTLAGRDCFAALAGRVRAEACACLTWSWPAALLLPGLSSPQTPPAMGRRP